MAVAMAQLDNGTVKDLEIAGSVPGNHLLSLSMPSSFYIIMTACVYFAMHLSSESEIIST